MMMIAIRHGRSIKWRLSCRCSMRGGSLPTVSISWRPKSRSMRASTNQPACRQPGATRFVAQAATMSLTAWVTNSWRAMSMRRRLPYFPTSRTVPRPQAPPWKKVAFQILHWPIASDEVWVLSRACRVAAGAAKGFQDLGQFAHP